MLQEVFIAAGTASYAQGGQRLGPCKQINFIFGTNGSGKTTISRVIAEPDLYPKCALLWENGREIEPFVYNSDFTARNYASEIPGIFTLGKASVETLDKIKECIGKQGKIQDQIQKHKNTLEGADGDKGKAEQLNDLRSEFEETCWKFKARYNENFRDAFDGYHNNKAKFCDRALIEAESNKSPVCAIDDLRDRAKVVFQKGLQQQNLLPIPSVENLAQLETDPILSKKIFGKEDVGVAALITRLGNADWVKQGRRHLGHSKPHCPFCQQELLSDLSKQFDEYFDETYTNDLSEIERVKRSYDQHAEALTKSLQQLQDMECEHLDNAALSVDVERLVRHLESNKLQIERKKAEPSVAVKLEPIGDIVTALRTHIEAANISITKHNELVKNQATEKARLIKDLWRLVVDEAKTEIEKYNKTKEGLEKAISSLNTLISEKRRELLTVQREKEELERSVTSVQPTVNAINGILKSFGFHGFSLATAGGKDNLYKIVRNDGSDAHRTLSEGEKTFITFLYFYHLIKGSTSETGATTERVVVFDDPVSSLDGDVLFIVSSLIKKIVDEVCNKSGNIKQVFVLTHNVYFHKEVAFDTKRKNECRHYETFWVVRKRAHGSVIEPHATNPIKTSYDLLWEEVRKPKPFSTTIQNTMRRIIENYFIVLGNRSKESIIDLFDGSDKQICASLFLWVNDGSHAVYDDLYISPDDSLVDKYLEVFREIFVQTGQLSHYEMMMGIEVEAEKPLELASPAPEPVAA